MHLLCSYGYSAFVIFEQYTIISKRKQCTLLVFPTLIGRPFSLTPHPDLHKLYLRFSGLK